MFYQTKNNKPIIDSIALNVLYSNLKSIYVYKQSSTKYKGLKRNF